MQSGGGHPMIQTRSINHIPRIPGILNEGVSWRAAAGAEVQPHTDWRVGGSARGLLLNTTA
jgi:hypothetical protein